MKISIVTVCKNAAEYIAQTIESVLFQKGNFELEYIIVDGKSTDGTLDILRRYEQQYASITVISQSDTGMYDALSTGFRAVSGDVVAYINADDFYLPGAFSTVTAVFSSFPDIYWISGMSVRINTAGEIFFTNLHPGFNSRLIEQGFYGPFLKFVQQESVFFRAELLKNVDFSILSSFSAAGDFYLWRTFARNYQLYAVEALIGGFRFREGQISQDIQKYWNEFNTIRTNRSLWNWGRAMVIKTIDFCCSARLKKALFSGFVVYDMQRKKWVKK